jgi:hypothetical protein
MHTLRFRKFEDCYLSEDKLLITDRGHSYSASLCVNAVDRIWNSFEDLDYGEIVEFCIYSSSRDQNAAHFRLFGDDVGCPSLSLNEGEDIQDLDVEIRFVDYLRENVGETFSVVAYEVLD